MALEAATYIASLVATNPVGSTDAKSQGDDHLRLIKGAIKNSFPNVDKPTFLNQARVDVPSATITTALPAATSDFLRITGTTTITGFGTMAAGYQKDIVFGGILTLTYNATSLILPSAVSIVTAAGDTCRALSLGAGNWIVTQFERFSGKAIVPPTVSEISTLYNTLLSGFVGVLFDWPGTLATVPTGFLPADGRLVSRTTYSAVFAKYGITYSAGDGSTTFGLPDVRGRIIAEMDNPGTPAGAANRITSATADALAGVFGAETHTLALTEIPSHTHTEGTVQGQSGTVGPGTDGNCFRPQATNTGPSGGGGAHNNVQPTIFMHKIIWMGV